MKQKSFNWFLALAIIFNVLLWFGLYNLIVTITETLNSIF